MKWSFHGSRGGKRVRLANERGNPFPFSAAAAFDDSFIGALTRRVCANEAVESFSNAFGAENGDASQTEVSLRGAIREDRDAAIRSPFLQMLFLFIHSAMR